MRRKNKKHMYMILVILLLMISVGYAILNANLAINGTTKISNASWNVHFENYQQTSNSTVTPASGKAPVISGTTTTEISYEVDFTTPGDVYEFNVDVKNGGTIDAMIQSVQTKIKIGNGTETVLTSSNLPTYLIHSFTYSDGIEITSPHRLDANEKETLLVRVEFKRDITSSELEEASGKTIKFTEQINYVQADDTAVDVRVPVSFADDSWSTIAKAVKSGNTSLYHVGDTKTINMGSLGIHTLRISNMSTPSDCSTSGFSQTACGFVLEFADVITSHKMNSTNTNVGGWPACDMRTYVNDTIYNALPDDLKNNIIDTTVVSSHGSTSGEDIFTSTDKIYLLSSHEVWATEGTTYNMNYYDNAYNNTRQLDFYASRNVTANDNWSEVVKQIGKGYIYWWLRSASANSSNVFHAATANGLWSHIDPASDSMGVSPAFRIG